MSSRYSGILHKLADAGPSKRGNWNQLLNYLEGHAVGDPEAINPKFDSPFPPFTSPSDDLARELKDLQGPRNEDTPLRIAVRTAPATVIAALVHLGPDAAKIPDHKGRLPLHWACRRPPDNNVEKIMKILILAYPESLTYRDEGGRTPLHWLFWYHAKTRTVQITELFCQPLSKHPKAFVGLKQPPMPSSKYPLPEIPTPDPDQKIPTSAVIVHDSKHGALPLHYAVTEGAPGDVVRYLLTMYPQSKMMCDRMGRTALAWYLGAGELGPSGAQHVSGESPDPNAIPIYEQRKSSNIIQLLLNSKVARTSDDVGRFPLHWACHLLARHFYSCKKDEDLGQCLSVKAVKMMLDTHVEALVWTDIEGKTPLHILFDTVGQQQELDWTRISQNKSVRDDVDLVRGGNSDTGFHPPIQLVELLLQSPDTNEDQPHAEKTPCAAHVEDKAGRLPIHAAVATAMPGEIIQMLIQAHPTSLVHTTEEQLLTPLHCALGHPYTTPLQSINTIMLLLQAYVTSRHGTYVNGRLALKMEDANGKYPLHFACENQACLEVLRLLLEKYPRSAGFQSNDGDLALHLLMEASLFGSDKSLKVGASLSQLKSWTSDAEEKLREEQRRMMQQKISLLIEPIRKDAKLLQIKSSAHGMMALHMAVAFDAVPYSTLYNILDTCPVAAMHICKPDDKLLSALDFHDLRQQTDDKEQWHMVQELLFAFSPTLDNHRHKSDLLERCCRIVRDESEGRDSSHAAAMKRMQEEEDGPEEFDMEAPSFGSFEAPTNPLPTGGRPQDFQKTQQKQKKKVAKAVSKSKFKSPKAKAVENENAKKSIYDEDGLGGYEVSLDTDDDDSDDYFSEDDQTEEEYFSDDYDSRYDDNQFDENMTLVDIRKSDPKEEKKAEPNGNELACPSSDVRKVLNAINESPTGPGLSEEDPEDAPLELSDVAMRLWTFFNLYDLPDSPSDHYGKQVETILDELDFNIVEKLVNMHLPAYATNYLVDFVIKGRTIRDVANVHCKAAIYAAYIFVGRYDFRPTTDAGILLHRSPDGSTIVVRATEHNVITEEKELETQGKDEADIWATGVVANPKSTFRVMTRTVCFKFMKNQESYFREVRCRSDIGVPLEESESGTSAIVPLKNHFDLHGDKRKIDRRYKLDVNDERFKILYFEGDESSEEGHSIRLPDYPFAVVMPYNEEGDLYDQYVRYGMLGMDDIRNIGAQIGRSLQTMHEKAVIHSNVSMRNIVPLPSSEEGDAERHWALADLSCACRKASQNFYVAGMSASGSALFSTGSFPPEMFVKLGPGELKRYSDYWDMVERMHNISVDRNIIKPHVDAATGDSYVLRCHFMQEEDNFMGTSLPYKLVPAREPADIWAFGLILFTLCSSGRPLFPTNPRTGCLLSYEQIAKWDKEAAQEMIYEHIEDPLAQDLLLHMLGPYETRATLSMEMIMLHPFFAKSGLVSPTDKNLVRIVDQRSKESAARRRVLEQKTTKHVAERWVQERTSIIHCWDLEFQMRVHLSPSMLMTKLSGGDKEVPTIPYSFIVLPYRLAHNKSGKMTPATKKDVAYADRMGKLLLRLSKACHFACSMEQLLLEKKDKESGASHRWSATEIAEAMPLSDDYKDLRSEMVELAAKDVELFRDNPLYVTNKLIQKVVKELHGCFADSMRAFVYLVDEYGGLPVVAEGDSLYPLEVTDRVSQLVNWLLPFMHMSILYWRGVAGGVAGLVKLIFEGAYPKVPASWDLAAKGLPHVLDEKAMLNETRVLHDAIMDVYSSKKTTSRSGPDLRSVASLFHDLDTKRSFAGLKRLTNGEASIWTTDEGLQDIRELAKTSSFSEAYRAQQASKEKIEEQEATIEELQKRIDKLEFRNKLGLTAVPSVD